MITESSAFRQTSNPFLNRKCHCPFPGCPHHRGADKPFPLTDKRTLRKHLKEVHHNELHMLTDAQLDDLDLYLCRETGKLCLNKAELEWHMNRQIKKQNVTNLKIFTNSLYPEAQHIHSNHWQEGLLFLRHHSISTPTFHRTLITKINHRLKKRVLNTDYSVLESCTKAHKQSSDRSRQFSSGFDPTPTWKLPFIFERLVLGPTQHPQISQRKTRKA